MKIIAIVKDEYTKTYIAEVTDDELATIAVGELRCGGNYRFGVGTEVKVGDHWTRVKNIESAQDRLNSLAQSIRAVADLLGTINVVVPPQPPSKSNDDCK